MTNGAFYLGEDQAGDAVRWRAPSRQGVTVTPLIDGRATYEAMEDAASHARHTLYLTGWILRVSTPVVHRAAVGSTLLDRYRELDRSRGDRPRASIPRVSTWPDLLAAVAGLGVHVRVLLSDFDPVLHDNHRELTWPAYAALRERARTRLGEQGATTLEVMCHLHDHTVETGFVCRTIDSIMRPELARRVAALNRVRHGPRLAALSASPGLWSLITFDPAATPPVAIRADPAWAAHPCSHHQKTMVVDGTVGFCGGIDLSPDGVSECVHHTTRYHDLHCRVDGALAADLHRNVVARWNRERVGFNAWVAALKPPHSTVRLDVAPVTEATEPVPPPSGTGTGTGQLLRTISVNGSTRTPSTLREDIKEAYANAIGRAARFVYLENQYLRSRELVDWIVDRCDDVPELVVLATVPVAPEELKKVLPTAAADPMLHLGMHLQYENLTRLVSELGPRFAAFSMAERDETPRPTLTSTKGRRQIYTHSKAMIVDDDYLLIGSANGTARSFYADSEAAIGCADTATVRAFRLELWGNLLGHPPDLATWAPADFVARWSAIAATNVDDDPARKKDRRGWIVPHDHTKPLVRGTANGLIPDLWAVETQDLAADDVVVA